jgi:2-haloacid dehalogenase
MAAAPLDGVRACVFDAYGTLFDLASAVARQRSRLGDARADELSRIWRAKQLEYTWLRSLMGRHADFWRVTGDGLDHALDALGLAAEDGLRDTLMQAYLRLDAYPEVPAVLRRLREAGLPCAILSNGSPAMLDAGVESAGLAGLLGAVLSVESVGVFKPHPSVYRLAVDRLGVRPDEIAFQSSNAWDVHGAAAFGFRCVWVNRGGARPERLPGAALAELRDLGGLPDLLGV